MLQSGQCLRLARAQPGDLEHDGSIAQPTLLGAEDSRERAAAQFLDKSEAGDRLARFREGRTGVGLGWMGSRAGALGDESMNLDNLAPPADDRGKTGRVLVRIGDLTGLFAEAILLVDQGHEGLVIDRRIVTLIPLDADRLAGLATQGQIGAEEGQQGPGALARPGGEEFERIGPRAAGGTPRGLELLDETDDLGSRGVVPGATENTRAHRLIPPPCPRTPLSVLDPLEGDGPSAR